MTARIQIKVGLLRMYCLPIHGVTSTPASLYEQSTFNCVAYVSITLSITPYQSMITHCYFVMLLFSYHKVCSALLGAFLHNAIDIRKQSYQLAIDACDQSFGGFPQCK